VDGWLELMQICHTVNYIKPWKYCVLSLRSMIMSCFHFIFVCRSLEPASLLFRVTAAPNTACVIYIRALCVPHNTQMLLLLYSYTAEKIHVFFPFPFYCEDFIFLSFTQRNRNGYLSSATAIRLEFTDRPCH